MSIDLGIAGRTALVCAASRGLGRACAEALAQAGVSVVINGRTAETLRATAEDIARATGASVSAVAGDVTTAEGRAAILAVCPAPDLFVNITSAAVKAPIETLGLSNGARAGLTGFVASLARQVARHNVAINTMLPGPFETDRLGHPRGRCQIAKPHL